MQTLETNKKGIEIPQKYEAPVIEMIEIEVEKGFAASPSGNTKDGDGSMSPANPGGPWSNNTWLQ
jgi:hypothetical protein